MNTKEIWKPVKGFELGYEISNHGRLKSISRVVDYGLKKAIRPSKILKPRTGKSGYSYTNLSINKIRKTKKIHRLVAEAFLPLINGKINVNHIDGDKLNNKLSNLEWCTSSENTMHAYKLGLKNGVKGEKSHLSKLTKEDVLEIRHIKKTRNLSNQNISEKYNCSCSQIQRIVNRTNWTHI